MSSKVLIEQVFRDGCTLPHSPPWGYPWAARHWVADSTGN